VAISAIAWWNLNKLPLFCGKILGLFGETTYPKLVAYALMYKLILAISIAKDKIKINYFCIICLKLFS
jgi:general stress protein CsbA